tara:strand:+ start:1072 stop:1434 length:363 start_codon:yes stop_codon:yes gene_type:complete
MKKLILFSIILLFIDIWWIQNVMKKLYENIFEIKQINYISAIIAYLAMIYGFYTFVFKSKTSSIDKIKKAFILGAVIYATYGFTLSAINNKYPISLAFIETAWGSFLFSFVTFLVYFLHL